MLRLLLLLLVVAVGCSSPSSTQAPPISDAPWPEWAFHHWVWENASTQQSAIALVDDYLAHDIPVGAIIIDSPWETSYNSFVFDQALFPDPQAMVDYFHERDVRVFLWITSTINLDSPLYAEAAAKGYFMQVDADSGPAVINWWKGDGSLIDFFNPDALGWWHAQMDNAVALAIDGWKCDGTDPFVVQAPYSSGLGRAVSRTEYGFAYYQDSFDYLRDNLGDDRIITARPVDNQGTGSDSMLWEHAPPEINWAGWVGDQDGTFEGIAKALDNMYLSSEHGYVAYGSDIGGFRTDHDTYPDHGRPKDAFIRWAQLGAFNPVMENGGGGEHRPWMFDEQTTDIYREFVELHYALLPYLMQHGATAFDAGVSLMTFLNRDDYAFLLGPDIFVAPMLEAGNAKTVAFPEGRWVYAFDANRVYQGGSQATLDVPIDEFPAFVREGSAAAEALEHYGE